MRHAAIAMLMAGLAATSLALSGCEELEPFEPVRADAPFRFFGGSAAGASVFLTEVAVTDTTVRLELRARDVERLTAVAFELVIGDSVAVIDTAIAGDFFQPQTPIVFELVDAPGQGPGWLGVISLTDFSADVSGGGRLASIVIRRVADEPFDVRLGFDTGGTRLYGPAGAPLDGRAVGGRLVFDPGSDATSAP